MAAVAAGGEIEMAASESSVDRIAGLLSGTKPERETGRPCLRPSSASIGWCWPHRPSRLMPALRGSCAVDGSAVEAAAYDDSSSVDTLSV